MKRSILNRLPPKLPHKLILLLSAYGCFFLVVICTQLTYSRLQLSNHGDGTIQQPCQQGFSLLRFKQKGMRQFHAQQLESKEFKRHVQEVLRPQPHHTEKYVIKQNWQAYDGSRQPWSTDTDVVMLIQSSPDRLPFVRHLAARWQGPISLAVYIPAPVTSDEAAECNATVREYLQQDAKVNADHPFAVAFMYANGLVPNLGCSLDAHSTGFEDPVVDEVAFEKRFERGSTHTVTWESVLSAEYPVNALRTLAKDLVESNVFVFLSEADFMPVHNMHKKLRRGSTGTLLSEARHAWHSLSERRAIIVPAFEHLSREFIKEQQEAALNATLNSTSSVHGALNVEQKSSAEQHYLRLWGWGAGLACTDHDGNTAVKLSSSCWTYEGYSLPLTKPTLHAMVENGTVSVFHEAAFAAGHKCYDPHYWLKNDAPYEVSVHNPCEPYFIALRDSLPPFDHRFRGRLRDKVSILTQMAARATRFFVSPDHFITHLPHQPVVPLATLAQDQTVEKYSLVIPHVLTQIMLEEMKEMSQVIHHVGHVVPGVGVVQATSKKVSQAHPVNKERPHLEATDRDSTKAMSVDEDPSTSGSAATTFQSHPASTIEPSRSTPAGALTNVPATATARSTPLLQYFSREHEPSQSQTFDLLSNSNSSTSSGLNSSDSALEGSNTTSEDVGASSGGSSENAGLVATSNNGHWEVRLTPQKEAHAVASRSWMQELEGKFGRGREAVFGPDVENALAGGWHGLLAITVRPECSVDWMATAISMLALCCALGIVSLAVLR